MSKKKKMMREKVIVEWMKEQEKWDGRERKIWESDERESNN